MSAQEIGFATLDAERPTLVPPGDYKLRFSHYETKVIFKKPKLFVWFTIATFGEHFGKRVSAVLRTAQADGQIGKESTLRCRLEKRFPARVHEAVRLAARLDRIAMTHFEQAEIIGRIRTVRQGSQQRAIPDALQYSVVDELLRLDEAGK